MAFFCFFAFFLYKHVFYINKCLTIECLVRKCIAEEVPYGSFLQTAIVNRGKSCKMTMKKHSCLASMSRFILVSEIFQNEQFYNGIFNFFFVQANVGGVNFLAMVNIIIHLFLSFVYLKQVIYLLLFSYFFSSCGIKSIQITFILFKNIDHSNSF